MFIYFYFCIQQQEEKKRKKGFWEAHKFHCFRNAGNLVHFGIVLTNFRPRFSACSSIDPEAGPEVPSLIEKRFL